jgi:hypothetical protein
MSQKKTRTAFVIMPFGYHDGAARKQLWDDIYRNLFKPAIERALRAAYPGCEDVDVKRGDELVGGQGIIKKLVDRICPDDFVLVDATQGNPNVMLEYGVRAVLRDETLIVRMAPADQERLLKHPKADERDEAQKILQQLRAMNGRSEAEQKRLEDVERLLTDLTKVNTDIISDLKGIDRHDYSYKPGDQRELNRAVDALQGAIEALVNRLQLNMIRESLRAHGLIMPNSHRTSKLAFIHHDILAKDCPIWNSVWEKQMDRVYPHFQHIHAGIAIIEAEDFDPFMVDSYEDKTTTDIRCTTLPAFTKKFFDPDLPDPTGYGQRLLAGSRALGERSGKKKKTTRIFYEPEKIDELLKDPDKRTNLIRTFEYQEEHHVQPLLMNNKALFPVIEWEFRKELRKTLDTIDVLKGRTSQFNVNDIELDIMITPQICGSVIRLPTEAERIPNSGVLSGIFFHKQFESGREIYSKYETLFEKLETRAQPWRKLIR